MELDLEEDGETEEAKPSRKKRKMAARRRQYDPAGDGWHLDRRIPLALIFAVLVQFGIFVAAWTQLQNDVTYVKSSVSQIREDAKEVGKRLEHLTTLRAEVRYLAQSMQRMRATVDSMLEYEYQKRSRGRVRHGSPTSTGSINESETPLPQRF